MFVIDTNVASELRRPEPMAAVAAWIAGRDAEEIYLTAVSEAECSTALRSCRLAREEAPWKPLGHVVPLAKG